MSASTSPKHPSSVARPKKGEPRLTGSTEHYTRMSSRGVLTLPAPVRRALPKGTTDFRISQREDGVIELHPQMMIDASQAWFWTERWQEREREVDEHITAGRVREAKDADEVLAHLDSLDR